MSATLVSLLSLVACFAADPGSGATYRIDGKEIRFVEAEGLTVSSGCVAVAKKCSCRACEAARSFEGVSIASNDDRNPGALLCRALGALSVVGLDARGNERGFCRFRDESFVSNGSLYARFKKRRR
ncbi:MAG: hypothetical protein HY075_11620 [Deltaproteobacteria bacterium]|nr:hypothetical protein [Deltaproteobacteria bacterium]